MKVITRMLGPIDTNCYVLINEGHALVIDPGGPFDDLDAILKSENAVLDAIALTHAHFDHIGGNHFFPNAKIAVHKLDAVSIKNKDTLGTSMSAFNNEDNSSVDIELEEGDKIADFEVIHTPGHTSGGISLWDGETLICGDTIFAGGGVGRMDIGGSYEDMKNSVEKLMTLDVKRIFSGHGPIVEDNGKEHIKLSYSYL